MNGALKLYDLAGADDCIRFSPYCWRIRFALAHKGLPVETIAWRFTEKRAIAFSGQGKVPVLIDAERCVADSWEIAIYLEDTYRDRPSLFGSEAGRGLVRFISQWTNEAVHPAIARVILPDLVTILHEKDREYFVATREAAFGTTIDVLAGSREEHLAALRRVIQPLRSTLAAQAYLAGPTPNYADHVVFSAFQWARVSSPIALLDAGDPLHPWCERMLEAYGGIARSMAAANPQFINR